MARLRNCLCIYVLNCNQNYLYSEFILAVKPGNIVGAGIIIVCICM